MQKVRALIAQKEDPHVTRLQETDAQYARKIDPVKREMAKKYGVTYYSGVKTLTDLRRYGTDHKKDKRPFSYFLDATQAFASQYDVDVQAVRPGDPGLLQAQVPTSAKLETPNAKTGMASIVEALSDETVEFRRTAGLKHIKLVSDVQADVKKADGTTEKGTLQGYYIDSTPDTIYLNIDKAFDADTVTHEEQHERDGRQCGTESETDPALVAAGHHVYTGVTFEAQHSFDGDYTNASNKAMKDINRYADANDRPQWCKALAAYIRAGKTVEFTTSYHPNAGEANAEFGAAIASGNIFPWITRDGLKDSPMRRKAETILARDYMDDPASVTFIAATSQHAKPLLTC
jgi:hypothetical protein